MKKQGSQIQETQAQTMSKQPKKYVLTALRENGLWEPLSPEEMAEFERLNPDIAKFW